MPSDDLQLCLNNTPALAVYPPGATFGPRHLVDYEFVWIIEGEVEYCWNKTLIEAPACTFILCRPPATDFFRWDQNRFTHHAYFHFQINNIPQEWPAIEQWPLRRLPEFGDLLRPLFSHLLRNGSELAQDQLLLTAKLLLTAFISGHDYASEPPPSPFPDEVRNVLNFIRQTLQKNPAASCSLPQLAEKAFVTPEHLCRLFREHVEFSPMQTVRLMRLENALQMVARTNYPLKEISLRCGFAGANHFSRSFSEVYGVTPRQVRNASKAGAPLPTSRLTKRSNYS